MKKSLVVLVALALVLAMVFAGCAPVVEQVLPTIPNGQTIATKPSQDVEDILSANTQQNTVEQTPSKRPESKPNYAPTGEYNKGVVLVKNKDGVDKFALTDISYKSIEQLYTGSFWYKITLNDDQDTEDAVEALSVAEKFESVDYDYIMQADGEVQSIDISGNSYAPNPEHLNKLAVQDAWQYALDNDSPAGGSPDVIVAVIDTGVDYNHEDLRNNIWTNPGEIPGNGKDDDGNGYVDDVYGWDFVGNDKDPMDDNGHGTHVAGIVAAENNNIGTVGVAFNCKVMVLKAGNSSGYFNNSDIVEAIQYAYMNGASVINMSFAGEAISIPVQDALMDAYNQCVLVAAAGNDSEYIPIKVFYPAALPYVIGVMSCDNSGEYQSSFSNWDPANHNSQEYEVYAPGEAIPSTWPGNKYAKLNGTSMAAPVVSGVAALLRSYYADREVYANKFIQSQIVNTGTQHPETPSGTAPQTVVGAYLAMATSPKPETYLYEAYIFDNVEFSPKNNGNGIIDAGETIRVGIELMNYGGVASNVVATLDTFRNGDSNLFDPYFEITKSQITMSDIGTYSVRNSGLIYDNDMIVGVENYFEFVVAQNCPNDYKCDFNVNFSYTNGLDEEDTTLYNNKDVFTISVINGVLLPTQFTEDTTLTADNLYILPYSTYIHKDVTVTIEPGTRIQFYIDDVDSLYYETGIPYINVAGKLISNGTVDAPVEMFPCDSMDNYIVEIRRADAGYVALNYTNIVNAVISATKADHCYFSQNYAGVRYCRELDGGKVKNSQAYNRYIVITECYNSVFYKLGGGYTDGENPRLFGLFDTCIFVDSTISSREAEANFINCVFQGNRNLTQEAYKNLASFIEVSQGCVDVSKVYQDSTTGTNYLIVDPDSIGGILSSLTQYFDPFTTRDLQIVRAFAQALGGDIACIETEEELNFLISQEFKIGSSRYYPFLGLECGSDIWINGEPVADFIKSHISNPDEEGYRWLQIDTLNQNLGFVTGKGSQYFLIEIPNSSYTSADEVMQHYQSLMQEGLNNGQFNGNAILNNLNDTNIDHWLKVQGSELSNLDWTIGLAGNYWGTTNETFIDRMITEFDDYQSLADIVWKNYLTEAPSSTFPFVTDIYFINKDNEVVRTIGKETVQVVVEFNRDMDTSIPLDVMFGSILPYADYKIEGEYVDARTWVGEYTLKAFIENGWQYFRIKNGCAADDPFLKLYESDYGRFGFEIDTTSAQSMIMQAVAEEGQINLTWMQDDYDTLLGYNIYRSTEEDGNFVRINPTVIPGEENTFVDTNAEPGVKYWYTFTVVQTDFTESTPAGKVVCTALDTILPNIYHTAVNQGYLNNNLVISATATDNIAVQSVTLYYRTVGATEWKTLTMLKQNNKYSATIFGSELSLAGLEYYIVASDGVGSIEKGSATAPYTVVIKDSSAIARLGDVDGDGVVNTKDALMMMQAINDDLILTDDQFKRADLNKDGVISSVEALRILQYINGKVNTLEM